MKKAYYSLITLCIVPFLALSIVMGHLAKGNPNFAATPPVMLQYASHI